MLLPKLDRREIPRSRDRGNSYRQTQAPRQYEAWARVSVFVEWYLRVIRPLADLGLPRQGQARRNSGERSGDSPDRNGRAAHCVSMHHKCEEGVESDGVGRLNLPVNQDKHRADKFSQRARPAIEQKTKKGAEKRRGGAGLSVGVLGKQHMWPGRGRRVDLLG